MKALKWNTIYHMIIMESVLFIHKCVFENSPKSITQLLTFSLHRSQNSRNTRKPLVKRQALSVKDKQTLIFKSVYLYNKLPDIFKTYNVKKLKKHLKEFIFEHFPSNSIPKNENK